MGFVRNQLSSLNLGANLLSGPKVIGMEEVRLLNDIVLEAIIISLVSP